MSLRSAAPALGAALLFGASTPMAKALIGQVPPLLLAGLLYLGSGAGLGLLLLLRRGRKPGDAPRLAIARSELRWLLGAIGFGGVLGPALLMLGLARVDAADASLLLNLEGVLTAVIAWWVFGESADRRLVLGMLAIAAGGVLLTWSPGAGHLSLSALLIVGACAAWAVDNNLTRKVSNHDSMVIACVKGWAAGSTNLLLALAGGAAWPAPGAVLGSLLVGFLGYGLSLSLFVVGLRTLGGARTGAYFSVAPLFGVLVSLWLWPRVPPVAFWGAAGLMGLGVWLHVRERHEHEHTHAPIEHAHSHRHDVHHQHVHDFAWDGREPHTHVHRHEALMHSHPHTPDLHHRHRH